MAALGIDAGSRRALCQVLLALLLVGGGVATHPLRSVAQLRPDAIAEFIRTRVEALHDRTGTSTAGGDLLVARQALPRFYVQRQFAPAWVHVRGVHPHADSLLAVIDGAAAEGLRPADYHRDRLHAEASAARAAAAPDARRLAALDLLLTDAFLLYGFHLLHGRVAPETLAPNGSIGRRMTDVVAVLEEALASGSMRDHLHGLAPQQPEYTWLRAALARYRGLQRAGGWPAVWKGTSLRVGAVGPRVKLLRDRLRATGDLRAGSVASEAAAMTFDRGLEAAVERFQARHGLDEDGIVGTATLQALNVSVAARVRQIQLNMERWRWLPQDLGARHLIVNIAGFALRLVDHEQEVMRMRVVAGQPYRQTPVFSDTISYLVLNPYWHVPHRIAVEDKLPLIKQNPDYLAQQHMTLLRGWGADAKVIDPATVDWSAVTADNFPYRLRQDPGPQNALGRVKFMFPNRHNVYLHDTPSRSLFARAERSFSSGCIRLEHPLALARYLLTDQPAWTEARLQQVLDTNVERTVPLKQKMPVHLQYWTAWAEHDGTVHFRRDVYERDESLARALDEPPRPRLQGHDPDH
ncbi:MAG: L,D-transpeptidase family protein [Bacteroidetes bacterium]|nr:L,D-transpeptidase family protein [Bacteroidota bacterium]